MNKPTPDTVSRMFVRRAALQAYISRLKLTEFTCDEPSEMNLPPFEQVMGFAMSDIEQLEFCSVESSPAVPLDTHQFFRLKDGRALYQYDLSIALGDGKERRPGG